MDEAEKHGGDNMPIAIPPSHELPTALYANYAAANHTEYEVVLTFAQVSSATDKDEVKSLKEVGRITARPVARIAIPHNLLTPLIAVLEKRRDIISAGETEED